MGFDGPPPDGFPPLAVGSCALFVHLPPEEWPPLFAPWLTTGGPTHLWGGATDQVNPLKPHLQRISKITVCSRKSAGDTKLVNEKQSGVAPANQTKGKVGS